MPKSITVKPKSPVRRSNRQKKSISKTIQPITPVAATTKVHQNTNSLGHWLRILSWPLRWPLGWLWRTKWGLMYLVIFLASLLVIPAESARMSTDDVRFDGSSSIQIKVVPQHDYALVLGAGVLPDHTPTAYLKNRIETAVDLYRNGRVQRLLMSGDNSTKYHDEPTVMKEYAVKLGVKPTDIVLDYAGYNTYDSCYRAVHIFKVTSVTVVTQGYHLPRATMTCMRLGMDTIGVAAKHTGRDWTVNYLVREQIATAKAYVQFIINPQPTVLGKAEAP